MARGAFDRVMQRLSTTTGKKPFAWRTPEGDILACIEKLKLLEQNIEDSAAALQDVMDEAVVIGCDAEQMRFVLHCLVDDLRDIYAVSRQKNKTS